MARVLVVAAHPDDEVLGCGATIARHVATGDEVRVVIMAEGLTSRGKASPADSVSLRTSAFRASAILGVSELKLEGLPDNRLDTLSRLSVIKIVESHIRDWKPSIVYTHHFGDLNIDHQVVHASVITACRSHPQNLVRTLLFFEIPSSTEWQIRGSGIPFEPQWYVDITNFIDVKIKAIEHYATELRPWPHPRSLEALVNLAKWRGSTAGLDAAEAFMVGRHIK
jgi:LmbE family N-acetylglucosaminyl deacetylase